MRLSTTLMLPGLLAGSLLLASTGASADGASQPGDASMPCEQIGTAVNEQNAIVNQQTAIIEKANAGSATSAGGPSAVTEMDHARAAIGQRKADKATARAHALVALGQSKRCFK